jgi:hypothetical protein
VAKKPISEYVPPLQEEELEEEQQQPTEQKPSIANYVAPEEEEERLGSKKPRLDYRTGQLTFEDEQGVQRSSIVDVPSLSDFFKDLYSGAKSLVTDIGEGAPLGAEVSVPQAQQSFLGIKRMAVEGYFAELRGEKPASWATQNPLLIGDASILAMTQSNELERYQSDSQYQKRIKEEAIKFFQENQKEYDRLARKIEKAYKDADVSPRAAAMAQGFASIMQQAPVLFAAATTRNPYLAYSMLPIFSAQEAGRSYVEARNEGLSYQDAYNNAKINGIIEGITEAVPTFKLSQTFAKQYTKNKDVLKSLARDGIAQTITEYGGEVVNGVFQEINNTAFGLQTELRQVRENKKDPLYNGPTEIDLLKSISYNAFWASIAGSGSAITAKGVFELAPELKDELLKLDPNMARKLAREIEKGVRNADYLDQALERTTLDILNSGLDGTTTINVEDFLTDNYLAYQLGDPAEEVIEEEQILEINNALKERKTVEQVARPQDLEAAQKLFAPTTTEIDQESSPNMKMNFEDTLSDLEISEGDGVVNPINAKEFNVQEKEAIKNNIVNTRKFDKDDFFIEEFTPSDVQNYIDKIRDFNEVESDNLATSIAMMREAGMPYEIIEDINMFGMLGNDERAGQASRFTFAAYNPAYKNLLFTQLSGISLNTESANQTGLGYSLSTANINTTHALAHELGHHIDYGFFFEDRSSAHFDSPLFEVPEYEIATSSDTEIETVPTRFKQRTYNDAGFRQRNPELIIKSGTKGPIIREAFNILNNDELVKLNIRKASVDGSYLKGRILEYPMSSYISTMHAISQGADPASVQKQLRFIKGEIFAQMHSLYYTNRSLLEEFAPETVKLIERINNEISVDGFGNKGIGILRAFRSPRAPRSLSISGERQDPTTDRTSVTERPTGEELAEQTGPETRDNLRSPIRTRVATTGQYIGAPEGVTSPQALGALRRKILGLTEEGEVGRFWYEQSAQALLDVTGGDKAEADLLAQAIAITSPGTPVSTNMVYAVQAYSQHKAGRPINTGRFTQSMNKKLEALFSGEEWSGRKTNSFYSNIIGFIDPTKEQAVTTDLWMMKAFGFNTEAPSPKQYDFVEQEVERIADQLGWEPRQVQAAIWVAKKSQDEGTSPEVAKYDYSDALKENLGQISWESIPGATTNHMPEVQDATYEQLQEYHVAVSKAFLDEDGNDIIAKELGLLTPGNFEAPGYFEQNVNPGTQTEAVLVKKYRAQKDEITALEPANQELAEAYSAVVGILLKQDGVGYHKPFYKKNIAKKDLNGVEIDIGRPLSETETKAIAEAMATESGNTEYNPIASPRGARLINFDYVDIDNIKFMSIVKRALDGVQFDNNESYVAGQFAANTGYLGNNWEIDKNGEGYLQSIGRISPDLQGRVESLVRQIQPRIQEVDQDFSERYGWTRNESINSNYRSRPSDLEAESRAPVYDGDTLVEPAYVDFSIEEIKNIQRNSYKIQPKLFEDKIPEDFPRINPFRKGEDRLGSPQVVSNFVIRMPIDDYLKLTTASDINIETIRERGPSYSTIDFDAEPSARFDPEEQLKSQTVFLSVDQSGRVVSHEGRHRSALAQKDGAQTIPVNIKLGEFEESREAFESIAERKFKADGEVPQSLKDYGIDILKPENFGNAGVRTGYEFDTNNYNSAPVIGEGQEALAVAQGPDTMSPQKPEDSDMLLEVPPSKGSKPPPSDPKQNRQFSLGDENFFQRRFRNFKLNIVNNFDPVFTIENAIKSEFGPESISGRRVTDETDLYHGRVKTGVEKFERKAEKLIKFITDNGYTIKQYNEFIYNLHAPERNEYINTLREPGKPGSVKYKDRGSGIKTDDAIKYLKRNGVIYENGQARAVANKGKILLEAYNELHKPIINDTIKLYEDNGLVDQENLADWKSRYKYYVPLAGFAADTLAKGSEPSSSGTGSVSKAFSVSGSEVKQAKGRISKADFALEQTLARASAAVIRSEKNIIVKKLADLAREFPNDDVWQVRGKNKFMAAKPQWDGEKAIISFKEDGKEKVVILKDERLARGLAGWDTDTSNALFNGLAKVTRGLAMVNTVLDPEFMITNFLRDFQTAGFNLAAEQELKGGRAENLKILEEKFGFKSVIKNMKILKRGETRKEMNAEDQQYYDAFKDSGAETGYVVPPTIEKIQSDLNNMAEMYKGTFKGNTKKAIQSVYKPIEVANTVVENATRFTAFKAALELQGGINKVTPEQIKKAAILAKNLTINFNRKGVKGNGLNAAYMFFNASIQGSVNFFRGYGPGGLSKRKMKLAGGLTSIGFFTTLYNLLSSPEDEDGMLYYEKFPEYKHKSNYVIMLSTPDVDLKNGELEFKRRDSTEVVNLNGKPLAVTIPLPYGFNVFHNFGRVMAELLYTQLNDDGREITNVVEAAIDVADAMLGSFSPIGIAETRSKGFGSILDKTIKTGLPTIAKPAAELALNENWFGAPIRPEQFPGDYRPKALLRKKNDSEAIAAITEFMNNISGGNKYLQGDIDISPQTIAYLVAYGTGGLGRTAGRTGQLVFDGVAEIAERGFGQGQGAVRKRELNQIPFIRRLLAVPEDHVTSKIYYDAKIDIESYAQAYLRNQNDPSVDMKVAFDMYDARPNALSLSDTIPLSDPRTRAKVNAPIERVNKNLKALNENLAANEQFKKINPKFYYEQQEKIEEEILKEQKRFIKIYNEAIKADKKIKK